VKGLSVQGIDGYMPPDKMPHSSVIPAAARGLIPEDFSTVDRMRREVRTKKGRKCYALRKQLVEPVFGQIKQARGFRQFLWRGIDKVSSEWQLICTGHNLLKLFGAHRQGLVGQQLSTAALV